MISLWLGCLVIFDLEVLHICRVKLSDSDFQTGIRALNSLIRCRSYRFRCSKSISLYPNGLNFKS
jgi:hypothetical protein